MRYLSYAEEQLEWAIRREEEEGRRTSDLKPCPFCGKDFLKLFIHITKGFCVKCKTCGARIGYFDTWREAVETWNRRDG